MTLVAAKSDQERLAELNRKLVLGDLTDQERQEYDALVRRLSRL